ncbi:hypothetical protein LWI28_010491 [Acer negundo]|uniref:Uncharacterized protein n=1 Tax=Acer negundo TaxID=4023 RepID=A0AAD5I9A7_ACENE|nr:hypothetical protein LWI28_010491 [Acer negundo]
MALGFTCGAANKGKGRWIRKMKSKPLRFLACKDCIRIGVDKKDMVSHSSSLDSSSSGDETEGRCFMKKEEGEIFSLSRGRNQGLLGEDIQAEVEKISTGGGNCKGIDLCIDLRGQDSGNNNLSSGGDTLLRVVTSSQDTVVAKTQFDDNRGIQCLAVKKSRGGGT